MSDLALPIVFMLFIVVAEAVALQWGRREPVNWHDLVFNLNSGHIMLWLFRGLEITCYGYVAAHFSLGLLDAWPPLLMWLFALLAWDFGFYWLHRLHHRFRVLWAVHVVHHQGEHFNLSLGVRNSWYSSLTSIPFFLLLALAGVPLSVFVAVSIFHYSIQLFNHNALTPKLACWKKSWSRQRTTGCTTSRTWRIPIRTSAAALSFGTSCSAPSARRCRPRRSAMASAVTGRLPTRSGRVICRSCAICV